MAARPIDDATAVSLPWGRGIIEEEAKDPPGLLRAALERAPAPSQLVAQPLR